ncbi:MAG: hypothetical protein ACK526_20155 [Planctomyces sp.]
MARLVVRRVLYMQKDIRLSTNLSGLLSGLLSVILCLSSTAARGDSAAQDLMNVGEITPSATSACDGFWILSTHNSPQSFDDSMPRFCPSVLRYDACSGYRQSSFGELQNSVIPGIPVCFAVHGSFVDWQSVLNESRGVWKWLREGCGARNLQVIYFTWPSDRPYTPLVQIDIGVLGRRAARNGFYLADAIQSLPAECPVSMMGHSHGTRVISSCLHLMGGGAIENISHPTVVNTGRRIRAVFAASAIDHDWLNPTERYGCALRSVECLLNLQNALDPCLAIYPLRRPFSSRALGHAGFTRKDVRAMGWLGRKVRNVDVSGDVGVGHLWPNYFRNPRLAHRISGYICFPDQVYAEPVSSSNMTMSEQTMSVQPAMEPRSLNLTTVPEIPQSAGTASTVIE